MSNISAIKVKLTNNDKHYFSDGDITIDITLDNAAFGIDYSQALTCYIYADDFYPMCSSKDCATISTEWPTWTAHINSHHIWLPGKYTLLIREKDDTLTRATLTINEKMVVMVIDITECIPLGLEDVLTTCLEDQDGEWHDLACTPGVGPLRKKIAEHTQLSVYNQLRKGFNSPMLDEDKNLLICTANKDLTERMLEQLRQLMSIETALQVVDCSTLFDLTCNNPYEQLGEKIDLQTKDTLCLTNISALLGTGGKIIAKRIADKMRGSDSILWICDTRQNIESVLEVFPSMNTFFTRNNRVQLLPYNRFDMVQAFYDIIVKGGLEPSDSVKDTMARTVIHGCDNGSLTHWTLGDIRRFVAEEIRPRYIKRAIGNIEVEKPTLMVTDDLGLSQLTGSRSNYEESVRELNEMIGLDEIKRSIRTMANRARFYTHRRRLGLKTSDKATFHVIFTGNPGTGKTTVARMLGKIYHSLGLLSKGEVIAVDRTRLVGRYIGETEENMKSVLEEARGNVLFIDEAYTLHDGSNDRRDFGARVIDSLLTVLSQPDPDMLIVFAGYEKEMDAMLSTNPGLCGRFPYKYRFKDYTAEQLMEIACKVLQRDEYVLTDEARKELMADIQLTLAQHTRNFGNARWVEQFIRNGIIPALADRISEQGIDDSPEAYQTVVAADIQEAYGKFNPRTIELHPRRQIGFSA